MRPLALAVLALLGALIAGYLTAFQVHWLARVWDPVFGSGSERVLTSAISRLLPVPDASLGMAAYTVDAALALALAAGIGPRRRLSAALAIVATLGALTAIVLTALQPLVAGSFCSLCLLSAGISVVLAVGALAEARGIRQPPASDSRSTSRSSTSHRSFKEARR